VRIKITTLRNVYAIQREVVNSSVLLNKESMRMSFGWGMWVRSLFLSLRRDKKAASDPEIIAFTITSKMRRANKK
jgi:hypothetical protein